MLGAVHRSLENRNGKSVTRVGEGTPARARRRGGLSPISDNGRGRPGTGEEAIYLMFTLTPTINGFFESKAHNLRGSVGDRS